jgi:hypothetical protein
VCPACEAIKHWEARRLRVLRRMKEMGRTPWSGAYLVRPESYASKLTLARVSDLLPIEQPGPSVTVSLSALDRAMSGGVGVVVSYGLLPLLCVVWQPWKLPGRSLPEFPSLPSMSPTDESSVKKGDASSTYVNSARLSRPRSAATSAITGSHSGGGCTRPATANSRVSFDLY